MSTDGRLLRQSVRNRPTAGILPAPEDDVVDLVGRRFDETVLARFWRWTLGTDSD
jgi:hypothetical protein